VNRINLTHNRTLSSPLPWVTGLVWSEEFVVFCECLFMDRCRLVADYLGTDGTLRDASISKVRLRSTGCDCPEWY